MDSQNCRYFDFECVTCEGCEHFEIDITKYQMCNNCGEQFKATKTSVIEMKNKESEERHRCPHCMHVNIKINDKHVANKTSAFY